ncbi:hypothetical protein ACFPZ0_10295 [Streptomonospora nanhaiensis]|uniref:hypothetical protein n=1 Tax=Streptomonospora nanhaiensis TaxID=1323731 RepID=UPI001C381240|nr:hypothetical protein [Streptomonospora nanhaiensis]MBV2364976.1 hypothetical protein [Streptomonospora nanhaiensis]MBX9389808.1 hypothetical protein [Streptomonospora nanhaiensis]
MPPRLTTALLAATVLVPAGACGGDRTAADETTMAGVMCEDPVRDELGVGDSAQFDDSPAVEVTSAETPWTYEVTGAVEVEGSATEYVCTISTPDQGDSWTVHEVETIG